MNRSTRGIVVAAIAAIAGIAAFLKRPIRRPEADGNWDPVERGVTRRR